jgi:hypothetical protein
MIPATFRETTAAPNWRVKPNVPPTDGYICPNCEIAFTEQDLISPE